MLKKKLLSDSEQLFSVSLKKKARDIARLRAGQEGVSPKHAMQSASSFATVPQQYAGKGAQYASPTRMAEKAQGSSPNDYFRAADAYETVVVVEEQRSTSPSDFFKRPDGYGRSGVPAGGE
jgi:hypothetical protein